MSVDNGRRGLPCSILPDDRLWCVVGGELDGKGGGILEWCYDQRDAEAVAATMRRAGYVCRAVKYRSAQP